MIDQYPPSNGVLTSLIWRKTASGGETSLSGYDDASQALSYTPGQEQVYLNGILLVRGDDYTATNGTSITGLSALSASDLVQVNCYNNFSVASLPASGITGTISSGNLPSSSTSLAGIVQLTDSTSSTSTTTAATPNAVKSAYDLANGAIAKSIVDAKGDLIIGTSADAVDRLAAGTNGYTLVADSSTSTGLAYASSALAQPVINGAFDIWQRGTSFAAPGTSYTSDRWTGYLTTGRTLSRQSTNDTTNLPFIQYCARVARDSGNTSTTVMQLIQSLETVNSIPYAGRTVAFSFYARAGANFSSASSLLGVWLNSGTGTDQSQVTGLTGAANVVNTTQAITTTWTRYTFTGTVPSNSTQLAIQFSYTPVGTAGANDWFEITGVQIDLGSTALPFRRSGGTIQGELAAAMRYYQKLSTPVARGVFSNATGNTARNGVTLPVTMRATPSISINGTLNLYDGAATGTITAFSGTAANSQFFDFDASAATGFATSTQGRPSLIYVSGTGAIEASAEL